MTRRFALIVGEPRVDALLHPLIDLLVAKNYRVRVVSPANLALLRVSATADDALIDGTPVNVVIFRAQPAIGFAEKFGERDQAFASAETRAVWLHVLSLPSVLAVNRGDCDSWFVSSEWPLWRTRFVEYGVPVVPLQVGDVTPEPHRRWLQWSGGIGQAPDQLAARCFGAATIETADLRLMLWCAGEIVDSKGSPAITGAGAVLERYGVSLAALALDRAGRAVSVSTTPFVAGRIANEVALRLVDSIHVHAAGR